MPVQIDTSGYRGAVYILKANGVTIRIGLDSPDATRMKVYLENSGVQNDAAARALIQQMFAAELGNAAIEIES